MPFTIKKDYTCYIRLLPHDLKLGLILKKVHRVIKLVRKIHCLNNKHRTNALNDFERDKHKFLNNPVFDKTIQNYRKQRDMRFITNERTRNRLASSVNCKRSKYIC